MTEKIKVGFQTFVSDGGPEEFGIVREISRDRSGLTVHVDADQS